MASRATPWPSRTLSDVTGVSLDEANSIDDGSRGVQDGKCNPTDCSLLRDVERVSCLSGTSDGKPCSVRGSILAVQARFVGQDVSVLKVLLSDDSRPNLYDDPPHSRGRQCVGRLASRCSMPPSATYCPTARIRGCEAQCNEHATRRNAKGP